MVENRFFQAALSDALLKISIKTLLEILARTKNGMNRTTANAMYGNIEIKASAHPFGLSKI